MIRSILLAVSDVLLTLGILLFITAFKESAPPLMFMGAVLFWLRHEIESARWMD